MARIGMPPLASIFSTLKCDPISWIAPASSLGRDYSEFAREELHHRIKYLCDTNAREMDEPSASAEICGRLFGEPPSQNFAPNKEHSLGHTIPGDSNSQWSGGQSGLRLSSHECVKSDRSEYPAWIPSARQAEQQPATMSIQFGAQQHQHHHSHSHLHYYAPAEMQLRNEASSQDLNHYRSYQDQYYSNQHAQPAESRRYQANVMSTNNEPNYSVSTQSVSSEYQSQAIYSQRHEAYCQHHRTYQQNSIAGNSIPQELPPAYPYTNHLHQQHQNSYSSSANSAESLHNQPRSNTTIAMDIELTNNMAHTRPADQYNYYDHQPSAGYRDYYTRQYNNSSSYQYPAQERYMQIISHGQSSSVGQHQTDHRSQVSSRSRDSNLNVHERPAGGVILFAKQKKDQTASLKKRVRDNNTAREATLESQAKSAAHSCRSQNSKSDNKQASKSNQCHICNRHYARPSTLKTHLRTHTNERPYECSVCCKTFSQAANLTAHQRVHTGERPFPCPICGRQFSQSSSVITHLRTHSGERPYRCNMCHRTFSDSSTLTKHCRIHSGEKPYQCEYCQLNFSQSGNLSRHIRLHLLNGLRNPLRVSTPASEALLQARQQQATAASSDATIPASFSSSSSNSSSTSTASF